MALNRLPQQLGAGLPFLAGEVIVLPLGAQGQGQSVIDQGVSILEKEAEEFVGAVGNPGLGGWLIVAGNPAVSQAGGNLVAPAEPGFVAQLAVLGMVGDIEKLIVAGIVVIIDLHGQPLVVVDPVLPVAEQVAAIVGEGGLDEVGAGAGAIEAGQDVEVSCEGIGSFRNPVLRRG